MKVYEIEIIKGNNKGKKAYTFENPLDTVKAYSIGAFSLDGKEEYFLPIGYFKYTGKEITIGK